VADVSIKRSFLKGGFQLALGQVGQQAVLLARNVIVARLLPPEQFGIALTFVTVMSALDAVSEFGIELYLIRSAHTETLHLQRTLQSLLMLRGFVSAFAIFILAYPVAYMFKTPSAAWAYQCLAVVPAIRSFLHLDMRRFEKTLVFWPGILNNFAAAALGTIAAVVAALLLKSYVVLLIAYITQTISMVVGSHLFAKQKYQLGFDRKQADLLLAFGGPLILNNLLLFSLMQGDRIIIGASIGIRELANYGVISILTVGVTGVALKLTGSLYLPILSSQKSGSEMYNRRYEVCGAITALLALVTILFFAIFGQPVTTLLFGSKYDVSVLLATWLGMQSAFKILRSWPQVALIASGATQNLLLTNLVSALGLCAACVAAWKHYHIEYAAMGMALGEVLAALVAFAMVRGTAGESRHLGQLLLWGLVIVAGLLLVLHMNSLVPGPNYYKLALFLGLGLIGVSGTLAVANQFRILFFLGLSRTLKLLT
jgi:O-antigen/teichoic acid export membrane protein